MTQGFVVNGLVSVVTPTIEKRFQLLGIESGVILSMYNVASCIMVMPVSYYGGVGHKPVIMGIGALVMATGSMVFCSPHFLAPPYLPSDVGATDICPERGSVKCAGYSATHSISSYKYYFMLGHALHGIGSSPFFTLGVAYLDQNTPSEKVSVYMGIFYATSILGPALGFLLGAYFLSKFTDLTVDSAELGISSTSNSWVGAWWVGFFGASIVTFLTSLPMSSFPRFLPTSKQREKDLSEIQRKKQKAKTPLTVQVVAPTPTGEPAIAAPDGQVYPNPDPDPARSSRRTSATLQPPAPVATPEGEGAPERTAGPMTPEPTKRSLKNHLKRLSTNATFLCLTFAAAAEAMIGSGLTGFATKIFISMFGVSPTRASSLLGMVAVPSLPLYNLPLQLADNIFSPQVWWRCQAHAGGTVLGGYAITRFNLKSPTIVRYCTILALVPWFTMFAFLKSCPSRQSAVINATSTDGVPKLVFADLERSCNAHCNCSGVDYNPSCGSDNLTYYSPCIAGCAEVRRYKKTKLYTQCTCVNGPTLHMTVDENNGTVYDYMAKRDPCDADCGLVFIYAGGIFISLFFTFLLVVPALTAMLRSLEEDIKSTGIGVNYVLMRIFGTIPGPIVFGHLIDRSCILWQSTCSGGTGACAIYENSAMGVNLFRVMIVVKSAAIMFFFCASLCTKADDSVSPVSGGTILDGEAGDRGGSKDRGMSPDDIAKGDHGDDGAHGDDRDDKQLNEGDNMN
ncbi:hypothetical protein MTO96_019968 [Rhipicephalus appendiculatus]